MVFDASSWSVSSDDDESMKPNLMPFNVLTSFLIDNELNFFLSSSLVGGREEDGSEVGGFCTLEDLFTLLLLLLVLDEMDFVTFNSSKNITDMF